MPPVGAQEESRQDDVRKAAPELRVLTLSAVYPNPQEPGHGPFIRSRMQAIARLAPVKVVAPVAAIDYSNPHRQWFGNFSLAARRQDGPIEVFHPRWAFPPFGTPLNGMCMFLRLYGPLSRLRKTYDFDLIDAHFGFPDGVAAALLARRFGCPFQVTLRGNEPIFARSPWHRKTIAWALCRASRVLAVSEELRHFALSLGVNPERTKTVPNGIDGSLFYPRERAACRVKYGLAPQSKVILSAGRLVEAKGHHYTFRALKNLLDGGIDAELLVAGGACREDRFDQQIGALIKELGLHSKVRLLGQVSSQEMPDLLSAADVMCLASFMEGWPNVIHEAHACGTPVVSTRVGGAPDMIPSDRYGYLVPVKDVPAMEDALCKALTREWDREAIAEWGRSRSWEQVAREVVEQMTQAVTEARQGTYVRN